MGRHRVPGPGPFTEEERDALLEYFRQRRWRLVAPRADTIPLAIFLTMCPFHVVLHRLAAFGSCCAQTKFLDLSRATLLVERSRSMSAEAAPKTSAAARLVGPTPRDVELLQQVSDPFAKPDEYVFNNTLGAPIDQGSFCNLFCAAQKRLGMRTCDLYATATKGNYVSCALTRGANLTWLSEQTGCRGQQRYASTTASSFMPTRETPCSSQRLTLNRLRRCSLPLDSPCARGSRRKILDLIRTKWWSRRDLNPRPLRCERSALPAELLPRPDLLGRDDGGQVSSQLISEFRIAQPVGNLGLQEPQAVAQIVTHSFEFVAVEVAPPA
jgi:hypothetical protein